MVCSVARWQKNLSKRMSSLEARIYKQALAVYKLQFQTPFVAPFVLGPGGVIPARDASFHFSDAKKTKNKRKKHVTLVSARRRRGTCKCWCF